MARGLAVVGDAAVVNVMGRLGSVRALSDTVPNAETHALAVCTEAADLHIPAKTRPLRRRGEPIRNERIYKNIRTSDGVYFRIARSIGRQI